MPHVARPEYRRLILSVACLALVAHYYRQPAIPQRPEYHAFADQRTVLGIQNGLNVLSNLPFLLVGIAGIGVVLLAGARRSALRAAGILWPYAALFLGTALTAFGSGHYHLNPNNQSLVWDRLPMAIGFMGLLGAVIGERVGPRPAQVLFGPLVLAGVASVFYWRQTELLGRGDLRPY